MHPHLGFFLRAPSLWVFVGLCLLWFMPLLLPLESWFPFPGWWSRLFGYLAAVAMLVPFIHIVRRWFRHRYLGAMNRWLHWHIGAAYVAFFCVLVHSRGQAHSLLSILLVTFLWLVMVSGVVGYFGQKLLYRLLPRLVDHEVGLERAPWQRDQYVRQAHNAIGDLLVPKWVDFCKKRLEKNDPIAAALSPVTEAFAEALKTVRTEEQKPAADRKQDKLDAAKAQVFAALQAFALARPLPQIEQLRFDADQLKQADQELFLLVQSENHRLTQRQVMQRNFGLLAFCFPQDFRPMPPRVLEFCDAALRSCLEAPLKLWSWAARDDDAALLSRNTLDQLMAAADAEQNRCLTRLWQLIESRRELDREFRLHHLGRLWLLVHGPAAWTMLVCIVLHIWISIRHGGF